MGGIFLYLALLDLRRSRMCAITAWGRVKGFVSYIERDGPWS
jgi:hypothetical protein